jgi:hypothetical protein
VRRTTALWAKGDLRIQPPTEEFFPFGRLRVRNDNGKK